MCWRGVDDHVLIAATGNPQHLTHQRPRDPVRLTGLDTVCAPSQPGEADRISGPLVGEMLRVARRCYEYVIIDTPPAFSEHVLAAFDVSDMAVLLANLGIRAVQDH